MEYDRQYGNYYIQKRPTKLSVAWIFRLLFFGCFFAAIFLANTEGKNEASWIGYLCENNLIQGLAGSERIQGQWSMILRQRLPFWTIFVCFSQTLPGLIYGGFFAAWQGSCIGFVFSAMLFRYGIRGILVFGALCFPHDLVYAVCYILMYRLMLFYRRKKSIWYNSRRDLGEKGVYIIFCILLSAAYTLGILLEYHVNPFFLEKIVRIL